MLYFLHNSLSVGLRVRTRSQFLIFNANKGGVWMQHRLYIQICLLYVYTNNYT
jgi:hypothetical protein